MRSKGSHEQSLTGLLGGFQDFTHSYFSLQALQMAVLRLLRPAHHIHRAAANKPPTEHNLLSAQSLPFALMFCAITRPEDPHRDIGRYKKKKKNFKKSPSS